MTYGRILEPADLPQSGPSTRRARERSDLDFKRFADRARMAEHSKDVAAFANALGGVIVIGADDSTGDLAYPGLGRQTVADVKSIYEGAARLCSPSPVVDVVPLSLSGRTVVAINVDPFVDGVVAAPARDLAPNQPKTKDTSWVFPVRLASQTALILPETLPMYMNREIRRTIVLLARIPKEARLRVTIFFHAPQAIPVPGNHSTTVTEREVRLGDASVERNVLDLILDDLGEAHCHVPLLDVLDVWPGASGQWNVKIAGRLYEKESQMGRRLLYHPMPPR